MQILRSNARKRALSVTAAAALAGASLLTTVASPASASPAPDSAAAPLARGYSITFYRGGNPIGSWTEACPGPGGRVPRAMPSYIWPATEYTAVSDCRVTAFRTTNGTGTGVGLTRDGRRHGFGSVNGSVKSIVAYG